MKFLLLGATQYSKYLRNRSAETICLKMFKFFGRGRRLQTLSGEKQKVPWEAESRKAADYSGFLHLVLKKKRKKLEKKKRLVTYSISSVT